MKNVYQARLSEMARAAEDIESFCEGEELPAAAAFAFSLCLDEVFTNICEYGYPGGGRGSIEIEMLRDGGRVRAFIRDDGRPFNPLEECPEPDLDAPLEERKIGGLGIYFLKKNMDALAYRREGGRNELMMEKGIPQDDA